MSTLRSQSFIKLILSCSVVLCTSAAAFDASVWDFEWHYPQTLTPETSQIQYSFRFQLSPFSYPVDCSYRTQLYLSRDHIFSSNDFGLLGPMDTLLSAGAVGCTATVARSIPMDTSLPASGTYYVFLEIRPGPGAPPDTNTSNNTAKALSTVRVDNGPVPPPPPPPPSEPVLTAATVITAPLTGRSMVVAGYNDGVLEFRDWQGHVLAAREGFKEITALTSGIAGSPPLPRLLVASTDSGGALRGVDPANINHDIVSHTNLGRITAISAHDGPNSAVYIGTGNLGGTIRKLNALTLATEGVRGNMGHVSDIVRVCSTWGDVLAVGSDTSGGSVAFIDMDTLDDVIPRQQDLGVVRALASADMDRDGQAELVMASGADDGSIQLREGPSFESTVAARTNLGEIYTLDYGPLGNGAFAWILFASGSAGGSLRLMAVDFETSHATIQDWAGLHNLGPIHYAEFRDFYNIGSTLVGAIWQEEAGPALHVLDENLIAFATEPVTHEDFETGDFGRFPWGHSGNAFWSVTGQEKHSGLFSASAGAIGHGHRSILYVRLPCVSGDITFYRKVSCERNYDHLRFAIDGVQQGVWSGEVDWAEVSFPVTAGTRTFEWTYSKDGSIYRGDDTAWIDDVVFPIDGGSEAPLSSVHCMDQPPCRIDIQYEFDR